MSQASATGALPDLMENALFVAVGVLVVVGLMRWASRPHTAFVLEEGQVRLQRGSPPRALLHDLADVAKAVPGARGRILLSGSGSTLQVEVVGLDDGIGQRVRNVVQVHQRRIR